MKPEYGLEISSTSFKGVKDCIVFTKEDKSLEYKVETKSYILIKMLSTNVKLLHWLALKLVYDYELTKGWTIKKRFKKGLLK